MGCNMKTKTFLIVLFLTGILFCGNSRQTREFYIELPESWIQIPAESVQFLIREMHRPALDPLYAEYTYLYQPETNDTLFTVPNIIIQVNKSGRLLKSDLNNAKGMKLDRSNNYLWSVRDSSINVIIPTEEGSVNIFCTSDLNGFSANKALFENVIKSIIIAHDLVYKDDFFHNTPVIREIFRKEYRSNLIFILIIIGIVGIRAYRRKSQTRKAGS